jgi:hypothetical protein
MALRCEERARLPERREADHVRGRGTRSPPFAKKLHRFLAAIWQLFNDYEIAGYIASRRPIARKHLRQLFYLR